MAKKGLGKGLDALFAEDTQNDNGVMEVKITEVMPNKNQPRKNPQVSGRGFFVKFASNPDIEHKLKINS